MKVEAWLKISARKHYLNWRAGAVGVSKSKPATKANEIAIKLEVEVPDSLFEIPELRARVEVPASSVSKPVIDAKVTDNIAAELSKQLGLNVRVSAEEVEQEQ
jgi:hypothetical protein